jgi:hypothetical protein
VFRSGGTAPLPTWRGLATNRTSSPRCSRDSEAALLRAEMDAEREHALPTEAAEVAERDERERRERETRERETRERDERERRARETRERRAGESSFFLL